MRALFRESAQILAQLVEMHFGQNLNTESFCFLIQILIKFNFLNSFNLVIVTALILFNLHEITGW